MDALKRGPGRPPGSPNKLTATVREALKIAFDEMGGADGLVKWGKKNPDGFYALMGKLIPIEITGNVNVHHQYTMFLEEMQQRKIADAIG